MKEMVHSPYFQEGQCVLKDGNAHGGTPPIFPSLLMKYVSPGFDFFRADQLNKFQFSHEPQPNHPRGGATTAEHIVGFSTYYCRP